jgi:hypothetical protein
VGCAAAAAAAGAPPGLVLMTCDEIIWTTQ